MKQILIIEDDITIRQELSELLKNSGYEVKTIEKFENVKEQMTTLQNHTILRFCCCGLRQF